MKQLKQDILIGLGMLSIVGASGLITYLALTFDKSMGSVSRAILQVWYG